VSIDKKINASFLQICRIFITLKAADEEKKKKKKNRKKNFLTCPNFFSGMVSPARTRATVSGRTPGKGCKTPSHSKTPGKNPVTPGSAKAHKTPKALFTPGKNLSSKTPIGKKNGVTPGKQQDRYKACLETTSKSKWHAYDLTLTLTLTLKS
jgi:hypothetical protein